MSIALRLLSKLAGVERPCLDADYCAPPERPPDKVQPDATAVTFLMEDYKIAAASLASDEQEQHGLLRLAFALLAANVALASFVLGAGELERGAVPVASIPGVLMPIFAILSWRVVIRRERVKDHLSVRLLPAIRTYAGDNLPMLLGDQIGQAEAMKSRLPGSRRRVSRSLGRSAGGALFQAIFLTPAFLASLLATLMMIHAGERWAPSGAEGAILAWTLVGLDWLAILTAVLVFVIVGPPRNTVNQPLPRSASTSW